MSVEKNVESFFGGICFHRGVETGMLRVGNMLKTAGFLREYFWPDILYRVNVCVSIWHVGPCYGNRK